MGEGGWGFHSVRRMSVLLSVVEKRSRFYRSPGIICLSAPTSKIVRPGSYVSVHRLPKSHAARHFFSY